MNRFPLPIQNNPLQTRDDLRRAFLQLTAPLQPYYSSGSARLMLGSTGTSYSGEVAGMEGFSRVLWGLVPLIAGGGDSPLWDTYMTGIANGTNPAHEEYWGAAGDYDQRSVEMAAFGLALSLIPEKLAGGLGQEGMERLAAWLAPINDHKLWDCNWLLFRVLVQMGFRKAGLPYDQELTASTLDEMERFYLGEGWYSDGIGGHSDYYVPFAIHYYGLLYAALMEDTDPDRARLYRERASLFAGQFIHWFADDGAALPYGRSLAYRFSQAAFWSALVFAGVEEPFSMGVMKGIILRHMRWWFAQPVFTPDGILTIGYAYPNLVMAENYNSPGSPYWAMKTFLLLALPEEHPFWTAEELPLPKLKRQFVQEPAHIVLYRQAEAPHVVAFNSGHPSSNEHTHTSAKYEKFAYSTCFGFSVPRAEWGLSQGAYDSMLALSEGDNLYRVKRRCEEISVRDGLVFARWKPWADVEVCTWIIPGVPWHVRIHRVAAGRALDGAEGGFALGIEGAGSGGVRPDSPQVAGNGLPAPVLQVQQQGHAVRAAYGRAASGVKLLYGEGQAELVNAQANTNVIVNRTVIPTVRVRFPAGAVTWLATAVYGEAFNGAASAGQWDLAPQVQAVNGELLVHLPGADSPEPALRLKLDSRLI
ncbi:MAG: hypothetical protein K0R57_306 [Paenibacillaceae bacterium]|jgi:hypothetical protein|nr:hypothetical protein [Paenibacillaceae bacterium]